ncbi:MAG: hypothetical protein Q7R85_02900 [bacterium]|nr:hypothetical protein [bacterium]
MAARAVLKERKKTITIGKEEWTGGWHTFVLDGQGHTDYSDGGSRSNPLTAFGIVSLWLVQDASRKPSDFMPWLDAELAKAKSPRPWWKWWG